VKLAILIVGLISSTAVLLLSVLYQSHWGLMFSLLLQMLPVLATRDELGTRRWCTPVWLAWCGLSLLGAGWLQTSERLQVNAVFESFGPGYLIMAVLAVIWPQQFNSDSSGNAKGR
jgi:hypothetical protein